MEKEIQNLSFLPSASKTLAAEKLRKNKMDLRLNSDAYPDVYEAFAHYNSLYFDDALGSCILSWNDSKNNRSAGTCRYLEEGACEIYLARQLKLRSATELKNTLLHEMIHAFLYITERKKDHSYHGPGFNSKAEAITRSSKVDPMRPSCGYSISTSHSLSKDDKGIQHWTCTSCGDVIEGSNNKEPSSASFCLEKSIADNFCANNSCHWHRHKKLCSGKYIINKSGHKGKKTMFPNDTHDDKRNMSAASSFKRKSTARQVKFSEDSPTNPKRLKTTGDHPDSKNIGIETPLQILKRPRMPCIRREDKKVIQDPKEAVKEDPVSNWSDDEDLDKDVVPLINKRTERRKIEKMLKLQRSQAKSANDNVEKSSVICNIVYLSDDD